MVASAGDVKLDAAATLLRLEPDDERATVVLTKALAREGSSRNKALEACARLGPNAKALVPLLAGLLNTGEADNRHSAAQALARMGPAAAGAAPALEKMLSNTEVPEGSDSTLSLSAAHALARLGRPGLPALVRRSRQKEREGKVAATAALGHFRGHTDEVVPVLIAALEDDHTRVAAALALGRLRPASAKARQALQKASKARGDRFDDGEEARAMARWALMQLEK
jgi:hypothetical protein